MPDPHEPEPPPMQAALYDMMRLHTALQDLLQVIEANMPGRDASPEQQADFLARLPPVVADAQLSLSVATGDLARHLRLHRATLN